MTFPLATRRSRFLQPSSLVALIFCFVFACENANRNAAEPASQLDAQGLEEKISDAFSKPDPFERLTSLSDALAHLNAENARGAGAALAKAYAIVGRCESDPVVSAWTALDTPAALEWALAQTGSLGRNAAAQTIFTWVGLGGGEEASAYLRTIPPAADQYTVVRNNIIQGAAARGDGLVAIEILSEMPADDTRAFLMTRMLLELIRRDTELVKTWATAVPEDAPNGLKAEAFTTSLELLARLDPKNAAQWFDAQGLQPWVDETSVASVANTYVLRDPEAGFDWILSQPPSETRAHAVREAAYTFLKKQPENAYPYLRANLAREGMQPAIFALSHFYASGPPEESLKWALRVPDVKERDKAILLPLMNWGRRDLRAASAWVQTNEEYLSPAILEKFTDEFEAKQKMENRGG